jgi:hypothetical protein
MRDTTTIASVVTIQQNRADVKPFLTFVVIRQQRLAGSPEKIPAE